MPAPYTRTPLAATPTAGPLLGTPRREGSSYLYDGDGKRASKTVGSVTTGYTYDVNASLPVLLDDGGRKYVWGLGLAYAVDSSGVLVYHSDGLGSVGALTEGLEKRIPPRAQAQLV